MLIITSPSKTQTEHGREYPGSSLPLLQKKSKEVIAALKKLDCSSLAQLLDTSPGLTETSYRRIQTLTAKPTLQNGCQAIFTYRGEAFSAIPADRYDDEDLAFAQGHLLILSALYGILRPLDLIQPYRLEMASQLALGECHHLYDFWRPTVTATVNDLLAKHKVKSLVNLASAEYSRVVDRRALIGPMITITFKERVGEGFRSIPVYSKRARGAMVHYLIAKRIQDPLQLKDFEEDGYTYDQEFSTEREWIFRRR